MDLFGTPLAGIFELNALLDHATPPESIDLDVKQLHQHLTGFALQRRNFGRPAARVIAVGDNQFANLAGLIAH
ncbi:hypothetical protein HBDW_46010 [Herbaspirillum sp. DW155]|uniref:hypothetical protein n=1 Tax=Herbaspirillum sp. DW155 TaxID=3095609 RepID=UPI003084767B|nr:hypothetical protein HBDW_46010 [Herbaspirillum sp. DW155]